MWNVSCVGPTTPADELCWVYQQSSIALLPSLCAHPCAIPYNTEGRGSVQVWLLQFMVPTVLRCCPSALFKSALLWPMWMLKADITMKGPHPAEKDRSWCHLKLQLLLIPVFCLGFFVSEHLLFCMLLGQLCSKPWISAYLQERVWPMMKCARLDKSCLGNSFLSRKDRHRCFLFYV